MAKRLHPRSCYFHFTATCCRLFQVQNELLNQAGSASELMFVLGARAMSHQKQGRPVGGRRVPYLYKGEVGIRRLPRNLEALFGAEGYDAA